MRDELKRYLISNNIYCPVHWPKSEYHKLNVETEKLYNQEISLVCDQRYSLDDMQNICKVILEFCEIKNICLADI